LESEVDAITVHVRSRKLVQVQLACGVQAQFDVAEMTLPGGKDEHRVRFPYNLPPQHALWARVAFPEAPRYFVRSGVFPAEVFVEVRLRRDR
jgi:hypothetical protein